MSELEHQPERRRDLDSDSSMVEWPDSHTEHILDVMYIFGLLAGDLDADDPDLCPVGSGEREDGEDFDPRHFYAAYVFDRAHERQGDVATLIEQAQKLGYPVRYWWLSEAIALGDCVDRLIVCVHHPSSSSEAGMDLYETLKEHAVSWNDLESAAVNEYLIFGKPVEGPKAICKPDRTPLFPPATG